MREVFMCRPDFFGVDYVINPWMRGNVGRASNARAREQWERLFEAISARARVETIEPVEGLPDMVFTANAGLVYGETFIPARFKHAERAGEVPHFVKWFRERRFKIAVLPEHAAFEGEGDALFQPETKTGEGAGSTQIRSTPLKSTNSNSALSNSTLWCGYGMRSSLHAHLALGDWAMEDIVALRLVDERFYHLDTCLCPLPGGRLLYYPGAFDWHSLQAIRARVGEADRYEVAEEDALAFACNGVVLEGAFIANRASDALKRKLGEWDLETIECPLDEFMLAGGAAKCLLLWMDHVPAGERDRAAAPVESAVEIAGHLLDTGRLNEALDCVESLGGGFAIDTLRAGASHEEPSRARIRVASPDAGRLEEMLGELVRLGASVAEPETDARLETVESDGVAPDSFYSTTIYPTEARVDGRWLPVRHQRMDAAIAIEGERASARCTIFRDLKRGDRVVCGYEGIRTRGRRTNAAREAFAFMGESVSSERRVELVVDELAWDMRRTRERGSKIVFVAGPVVIHTGGGPHLARLIRAGYVQALLGGNAIAVHDIEQNLFGTSLGVDMRLGAPVVGGHRRHLQAINTIRKHGSIAAAVEAGVLRGGVMFECVKAGVPFSLAGSIRDDGPLPETRMDLIAAQTEYARLIEGAEMILMLSSMLHSIGVGNMTPAGVKLICVDINPATVTKLADRGSLESRGIVTDVGLFMNLLAGRLVEE